MKNKVKKIFSVLGLTLFLGSCHFSKGFHEKPQIGLSYNYNGFAVGDVELYDTYFKNLQTNKIPENSVLFVKINGLKNYKKVDNKVYPGCKLTVTDSNGKVVFEEKDLYANVEDGMSVEKASMPTFRVRLSDPILAGQKYKVSFNVYDKKDDKNKLDITVNVDLTPTEVNINHEEKGLSFSKLNFVQKDFGLLPSNKIKENSTAAIVFNGLKGFQEESGKIYPACSLVVKDKSGNIMLSYDDLFQGMDGASPEDVYKSLYASITFAKPIVSGKEYEVFVHLTDRKNKENEIKASMDVLVVD